MRFRWIRACILDGYDDDEDEDECEGGGEGEDDGEPRARLAKISILPILVFPSGDGSCRRTSQSVQ